MSRLLRTALHAEFPVKQGKNREVCEISPLPTPPWTKKCSNYRDLAGQFPTQPNREFFATEQRTLGTEQGLNPTNQGNVFLASPVDCSGRFRRVPVKREIRLVTLSMVKLGQLGRFQMESTIAGRDGYRGSGQNVSEIESSGDDAPASADLLRASR
jgi:hypothetical protein